MGIIDANGNVLSAARAAPSRAPAPPGAAPPTPRQPAATPGSGAPLKEHLIVEVDESNFMEMVLKCPVPVVLDAYADWCEPCKTLTPRLTAIVNSAQGALRLAKLNVDVAQTLAGQLRVKSLPTVFGIVGGKAVTSFEGAPADEQLRSFFDQLLIAGEKTGMVATPMSRATEAVSLANTMVDDGQVEEAIGTLPAIVDTLRSMREQATTQLQQAADAGDKNAAQTLSAAPTSGPLYELDSLQARALAAMVRALVASAAAESSPPEKAAEDLKAAHSLVEVLRSKFRPHATHAEVTRALNAEQLGASGIALRAQLAPLTAKVAANPADPEARLSLAEAQLGAGMHSSAIDTCLAHIKQHGPGWKEGAARSLLLKVFEALGPAHPLTVSGRKQLGKLLFR